jgi:hypothetical protein
MSYNVAITLPPAPLDEARAWSELDAVIDAEGPTPAVFGELLDRLTARYPCINDLPDEDVDDGVWSDGPLRNDFGHRAAVLGIVYSRADEVLPFVISEANVLGLVVYDWGTKTIHRPSSGSRTTG